MHDVGMKRFLCIGFCGELTNLGNSPFPEAFFQPQSVLCALRQLTDTGQCGWWELSPPGPTIHPGMPGTLSAKEMSSWFSHRAGEV